MYIPKSQSDKFLEIIQLGDFTKAKQFLSSLKPTARLPKHVLTVSYKGTLKDALFYATQANNLDLVETLIKYGADCDSHDSDGYTCCHVAKTVKIFKLLMNTRSFDINVKTKDGYTPLMLAAEFSHNDILKLLLDNNVDIHQKNNDGENALHRAALFGNLEAVKLLLDAKANIEDKEDIYLKTPLLCAAKATSNSLDCVKELRRRGAKLDCYETVSEYGALHLAVYENNLPLVKYLVEEGADTDYMPLARNNGDTPLQLAAFYGYTDIVEFLASITPKEKLNVYSRSGRTALMWAVRCGNVDCVKILVKAGSDLNLPGKYPEKAGINETVINTTLTLDRSFYEPKQVIEKIQLLIENSAIVTEDDIKAAIAEDNAAALRVLLQSYISAKKDENLSIAFNKFFKYNVKKETPDCLQVFIEEPFVEFIKPSKEKIFNCLVRNNKITTLTTLFKTKPPFFDKLYRPGINAKLPLTISCLALNTAYKPTPLAFACAHGLFDLAKYFIEAGDSLQEGIQLQDMTLSLLFLAKNAKNPELIRLLLARNISQAPSIKKLMLEMIQAKQMDKAKKLNDFINRVTDFFTKNIAFIHANNNILISIGVFKEKNAPGKEELDVLIGESRELFHGPHLPILLPMLISIIEKIAREKPNLLEFNDTTLEKIFWETLKNTIITKGEKIENASRPLEAFETLEIRRKRNSDSENPGSSDGDEFVEQELFFEEEEENLKAKILSDIKTDIHKKIILNHYGESKIAKLINKTETLGSEILESLEKSNGILSTLKSVKAKISITLTEHQEANAHFESTIHSSLKEIKAHEKALTELITTFFSDREKMIHELMNKIAINELNEAQRLQNNLFGNKSLSFILEIAETKMTEIRSIHASLSKIKTSHAEQLRKEKNVVVEVAHLIDLAAERKETRETKGTREAKETKETKEKSKRKNSIQPLEIKSIKDVSKPISKLEDKKMEGDKKREADSTDDDSDKEDNEVVVQAAPKILERPKIPRALEAPKPIEIDRSIPRPNNKFIQEVLALEQVLGEIECFDARSKEYRPLETPEIIASTFALLGIAARSMELVQSLHSDVTTHFRDVVFHAIHQLIPILHKETHEHQKIYTEVKTMVTAILPYLKALQLRSKESKKAFDKMIENPLFKIIADYRIPPTEDLKKVLEIYYFHKEYNCQFNKPAKFGHSPLIMKHAQGFAEGCQGAVAADIWDDPRPEFRLEFREHAREYREARKKGKWYRHVASEAFRGLHFMYQQVSIPAR